MLGFTGTSFLEPERVALAAQRVKAGSAGRLVVDLTLPAGYILNPLAPVSYEVRTQGDVLAVASENQRGTFSTEAKTLAVPFQAGAGGKSGAADVELTFYYCR